MKWKPWFIDVYGMVSGKNLIKISIVSNISSYSVFQNQYFSSSEDIITSSNFWIVNHKNERIVIDTNLSKLYFCFLFQTLLKSAGAQGKPTVFLLTDTQIKEESFLEDVDSLLNTGEVANLFAADEKAEINEVRRSCIAIQFDFL